MLTLRATANHVIALQYLCMCLMSQMFLFYFIFYGGALVFLGGAGAPASPSLVPPMMGHKARQCHFSHKRRMGYRDLIKKIGSLETQLALLKGNKEEAIHTLPDTALHEHDCSSVTSRC